jgi:hypothetical protein
VPLASHLHLSLVLLEQLDVVDQLLALSLYVDLGDLSGGEACRPRLEQVVHTGADVFDERDDVPLRRTLHHAYAHAQHGHAEHRVARGEQKQVALIGIVHVLPGHIVTEALLFEKIKIEKKTIKLKKWEKPNKKLIKIKI